MRCAARTEQPPLLRIASSACCRLGVATCIWCRGKRRLTNDFASIVYRIKLLGFNAIRVQFKFSDLNLDIPSASNGDPEFFPCLVRRRAHQVSGVLDETAA